MNSRNSVLALGTLVACLMLTACQFHGVQTFPYVLFEGDPRHQTEPLIGDTGFLSDCQFGDTICAKGERVISGPFARAYDQRSEGIMDDATYRVTIKGEEVATIGATDFKKNKGLHFGLRQLVVPLTLEGITYEFYAPGVNCKTGGECDGYGFEIMVMPGYDGDQVKISYIKLEIIGKGDLTK